MWKFFFRGVVSVTVAVLGGLIAMYSISFYISTQGLELKQANKADETITLVAVNDSKKEAINLDYDYQISELKTSIADVRKSTWKGKLGIQKLNQIATYNTLILDLQKQKRTQLDTLESNHKASLKLNTLNSKNTGNKYFVIICVIMVLQIISNGFLMFSFSKIYKENNIKSVIVEDIQAWKNDFTASTMQTMSNDLMQVQRMLLHQFSMATLNLNNENDTHIQIAATTTKQPSEPEPEPTPPEHNKIGFKLPSNETNNVQRDGQRNDKKTDVKHCANCGKEFYKKHWNAKYCSDDCRIENWEKRNNKKLHLKKS